MKVYEEIKKLTDDQLREAIKLLSSSTFYSNSSLLRKLVIDIFGSTDNLILDVLDISIHLAVELEERTRNNENKFIVLTRTGKRESCDYAKVNLFNSKEEAENYCNKLRDLAYKYWTASDVIEENKEIDLSPNWL